MSPPTSGRVLLFRCVGDPRLLASLDEPAWDALLNTARDTGHLERLAADAARADPGFAGLPAPVAFHLRGAQRLSAARERAIHWELDRIARALRGHAPAVLLKGAAYLVRGLAFARSRQASDIDILVARQRLPDVTTALRVHGWAPLPMRAYDEAYYLEWMHELPPFKHAGRGTYLDIHHALLPLTSRVQPDVETVLGACQPASELPFLLPCDEDLVLHCAFHAFHQGEFDNAPRDVIDMFDLLTALGAQAPFWERLGLRAERLGVSTALWFALATCREVLPLQIPADFAAALERQVPGGLRRRLVAGCMQLTTHHSPRSHAAAGLARNLLHARSHLLRMPLPLLLRHLLVKSWMNLRRPARPMEHPLDQHPPTD